MSALFLLAMGGIHLFLVLTGTGGLLGLLFVLGTSPALVIALSPVSLFAMRSSLSYQLAPTALVVESIGVIVLAAIAVLAARKRTG